MIKHNVICDECGTTINEKVFRLSINSTIPIELLSNEVRKAEILPPPDFDSLECFLKYINRISERLGAK